MTQPEDPVAQSVAAWKKMTDEYLAALGKSLEEAKASGVTDSAAQQAERTYLEIQNLMRTASQQAFSPVVEAFGAVPLTEFQRLQDQVHTVLLRLDRIDDALRELRDRPKTKKKR
ncbi:MAG: hypothetical protein WD557_12070 [Dehalococcoidia bacterium]